MIQVWAEVKALVDKAGHNAFCLGDVSTDQDAAWRLRTAVVTLRAVANMGQFQAFLFIFVSFEGEGGGTVWK